MFDDLLIGIFLSLLLGALIGAQREMKLQKLNFKDFAGFRTFSFISIFGFIIGFLSFEVLENPLLMILTFFGFIILLVVSYFVLAKKYKSYVSETSQVVALLTFLIGILISLNFYYISILLSIIITILLVLGTTLHNFAKKISNNEVFATLKFVIISFVVLPILPNKSYGPLDINYVNDILLNYFSKEILIQFSIFNFYKIWLLVVLISGITYVGYILMKILGTKKGIFLTGVLGGLMSSTALTSSFSIESRKNPKLSNYLGIGVIIASSIMFFRIILEVAIVNLNLLSSVLFLSFMGFFGICVSLYFYFKIKSSDNTILETKSPFTLGPAIKFSLFFVFIIFISKLFTILFGNNGLYIVSFFSGLGDVDAITLTIAEMAKNGSITNLTASLSIFLAAVSNTIVKGGIAYFLGSQKFSRRIILVFILLIIIGIISFFMSSF